MTLRLTLTDREIAQAIVHELRRTNPIVWGRRRAEEITVALAHEEGRITARVEAGDPGEAADA